MNEYSRRRRQTNNKYHHINHSLTVSGQFTQIATGKTVHLQRHGVFFQEGIFCVMQLQWIVCGQRNIQTSLKISRKGVFVVRQKQAIVAER